MTLPQLDLATVLDFAIRSSAIVATAALLDAGTRGRQMGGTFRHLAWSFAFASVLLLLPVGWILPDLPLPLPVGSDLQRESIVPEMIAGPGTPPFDLDWLLIVYTAGALIVVLGTAVSRLALLLLWRSARELNAPLVEESFAELRRSMSIRRPVALRLGAPDQMPMTWGTLRPKILLPSSASGWSTEQVRIVLSHELGHVVRLDHLSQMVARVACALHWYNALIWYGAARLRVEQEIACDELVLRRGESARLYARSLLQFAIHGSDRREARGAEAMAGKPQLEARLEAILSRRPERTSIATSAISIAALTAVVLSAAMIVPTSSPPADAAAAPPVGPSSILPPWGSREVPVIATPAGQHSRRKEPWQSSRHATRPGSGSDLGLPAKDVRSLEAYALNPILARDSSYLQPPPPRSPEEGPPAPFSGADPGPPPSAPPPIPPAPAPPAVPAFAASASASPHQADHPRAGNRSAEMSYRRPGGLPLFEFP